MTCFFCSSFVSYPTVHAAGLRYSATQTSNLTTTGSAIPGEKREGLQVRNMVSRLEFLERVLSRASNLNHDEGTTRGSCQSASLVTESLSYFFPDMCQHCAEFQIVDLTCLLASSHMPSGLHSRRKAVAGCVTRCFLAATSSPGRDVFRPTIAPSPSQLCQAYAASPRILKCN